MSERQWNIVAPVTRQEPTGRMKYEPAPNGGVGGMVQETRTVRDGGGFEVTDNKDGTVTVRLTLIGRDAGGDPSARAAARIAADAALRTTLAGWVASLKADKGLLPLARRELANAVRAAAPPAVGASREALAELVGTLVESGLLDSSVGALGAWRHVDFDSVAEEALTAALSAAQTGTAPAGEDKLPNIFDPNYNHPIPRIDRTPKPSAASHSWQSPREVHEGTAAGAAASLTDAPPPAPGVPQAVPGRSGYGGPTSR
jgi:hypothetical protein